MRLFLIILDFIFARKFLYKINIVFLKLIIRFIGYNNHSSFSKSGELFFLKKVCKQNPKLCLDIGANLGEYSNFILKNSNSKVFAFEPMTKTYNKLKKIRSKFPNRFFIFNYGLGEKKKFKNLYYDKNNSQWANFNSEVNQIDYLKNNKKIIKCKIDTLDNVIKTNKNLIKKIDLIKIDTEGYEYEVLVGAKKTIEKIKPKYIQIEYNWHHLFKNVNLYFFSQFLKNYNVYKILPFSKNLMKIDPKRPEHNYFNYSNIVFKRKK
tara:strand:- start:687 stop:1478 length:792 start_codon:yes stop_codon:yes gene_type:complete